MLKFIVQYSFITSTWPHLRSDAGLKENCLCATILGAQRYEQFLQVARLYWYYLILLGLALDHPSASVSSIFVVLYIHVHCNFVVVVSSSLPFSEVSLV